MVGCRAGGGVASSTASQQRCKAGSAPGGATPAPHASQHPPADTAVSVTAQPLPQTEVHSSWLAPATPLQHPPAVGRAARLHPPAQPAARLPAPAAPRTAPAAPPGRRPPRAPPALHARGTGRQVGRAALSDVCQLGRRARQREGAGCGAGRPLGGQQQLMRGDGAASLLRPAPARQRPPAIVSGKGMPTATSLRPAIITRMRGRGGAEQ